ncbi:MAG: MCE family protein [Flavobacteriales bacterium]|nr:MCE family protein [Flavobacteriales bacterium]
MAEEKAQRFKLGLFVLAGTVVLVLTLYLMGTRKDLFSRSVTISADMGEVGGLRAGNNVRYAGIDVGIVDAIEILNDTVVRVHMNIRVEHAGHIRSSALASVGTDGLMGNKLVNLLPGDGPGEEITEGILLRSVQRLDTDAMMRTLDRTNDNLAAITDDLRRVTERLNDPDNLVGLLTDTALGAVVRDAVLQLNATAWNARSLTDGINSMVADVEGGKGAIGVLLADEGAEADVRRMLSELHSASDTLGMAIGRIDRFSRSLENDKGLVYTLTQDTALATDVRRMMVRLDTTTILLNEDLRALQRNWLLRKYFKEQEEKERK